MEDLESIICIKCKYIYIYILFTFLLIKKEIKILICASTKWPTRESINPGFGLDLITRNLSAIRLEWQGETAILVRVSLYHLRRFQLAPFFLNIFALLQWQLTCFFSMINAIKADMPPCFSWHINSLT
jgi:hypothetical protein